LFALWFWPRRRFGGQLFILMIASYSVFRFLTEAVRADAERGVWGPLSTSQIVSLVVLPISAGLWWFMTKRHARGLLRPTNLPFTDDDSDAEPAPAPPAPVQEETPA
jgi:prolipoprotein diacylglyceryltransferase